MDQKAELKRQIEEKINQVKEGSEQTMNENLRVMQEEVVFKNTMAN